MLLLFTRNLQDPDRRLDPLSGRHQQVPYHCKHAAGSDSSLRSKLRCSTSSSSTIPWLFFGRVHGVEVRPFSSCTRADAAEQFIADKSWQHTSSRSPRDDEEESNEESSRSKFRAEDGLILQSIVGGAVDPKGLGEGEGDVSSAVTSPVNDVLGPRLVKSVDEFSRSVSEAQFAKRCLMKRAVTFPNC
eukprot:768800-Hanusia_phi.AAC.2